jgi:uncharacterized protein YqjF (DUF2071 family)
VKQFARSVARTPPLLIAREELVRARTRNGWLFAQDLLGEMKFNGQAGSENLSGSMNLLDSVPEPLQQVSMLQSWCDLTFLHWRYPIEVVQRRVPPSLRVESFDGSAWVGITPFLLRCLRPKSLPPVPWISHFPETNCRTYVRAPDGHSGIWFFSLDAARLLAVAGARLTYGLPYAWSRMRVTKASGQVTYESARRWPDSHSRTRIVLEPGDEINPDPLDVFLTARFRLYSFVHGKLSCAKVDHAPWPLRSARVIDAQQTLTETAGLSQPFLPEMVRYSPGVDVRIGSPERIV